MRRLTARFAGKEFVESPRRIDVPKLTQLEKLERDLATFPTRRKLLTKKQFALYMDGLRQMRGAIAGMIRKVQNIGGRADQDRYVMKIGRLFLDAPPNVLETFIASRRNSRGRNLHAVAMARLRRATPQQLAEYGRRGGKATQAKARALSAAAAESTTTPRVVSATESVVPSELASK